jgi:hypothetical protein
LLLEKADTFTATAKNPDAATLTIRSFGNTRTPNIALHDQTGVVVGILLQPVTTRLQDNRALRFQTDFL